MMEAYIFDAIRTPRSQSKKTGSLYEVKPVSLLASMLKAIQQRNGLATNLIDDLVVGCATPVGDQGFNIAKAALIHAAWSDQTGGMQVNRFGSSGLEAVNLAASKVRSGWEKLVIAGGIESLSRIPVASDSGPLLYDPELTMKGNLLPHGVAADLIATVEGFSREALDAYAFDSRQKAKMAQQNGYFKPSIIPIYDSNGLLILEKDDFLRPDTTQEELAALPAAFVEMGAMGYDEMALQKYPLVEQVQHVHTTGNSAGMVDGASLVLVGNAEMEKTIGRKPRARILAGANVGVEPTMMLAGAAAAAKKALELAGLKSKDVDIWECNEVFASVVLKFQQDLNLDPAKVNVNGGAIALGHPLGATGAMLLGALLDELERQDLNTGMVAMPAAGGMGTALVIERV